MAVQNQAGNPIIDLNAQHRGNTLANFLDAYAFRSAFRSRGIETEHARQIVELLVNCRDNRGNRILDIAHAGGNSTPLIEAVKRNDLVMVQLLLDLRNNDGSFAIDVNQTADHLDRRHPETALYVARSSVGRAYNPEIIQLLENRIELQRIEQEGRRNNPLTPAIQNQIIPAEETTAERNIRQFNQHGQNTHRPEVERTVDQSIAQLKKRYENKTKPSFDNVKKEIATFIAEIKKSNTKIFTKAQIENIEKGFAFISKDSSNTLHTRSKLHLRDIITLIWMGAHDKEALPNDFPRNGDVNIFITGRKQALLDKLIEIVTAYPARANNPESCLGGTRNLIVEALNKSHPDVSIAPTSEAVQELAIEEIKKFMLEKLLALPFPEQRKIINAWDDDSQDIDDSQPDNNPAKIFRDSIKDELKTYITSGYLSSVLDRAWLDTVLGDQYDFLPKPIIHAGLFKLIDEINQLQDVCLEVSELKASAKNVFNSDNQKLFDHDYSHLLTEFNEKKPKMDAVLNQRTLLNQSEKLARQEIESDYFNSAKIFERFSQSKPILEKLISDLENYTNKKKNETGVTEIKKYTESSDLLLKLKALYVFDLKPSEISMLKEQVSSQLKNPSSPDLFKAAFRSELKGYYERTEKLLNAIAPEPTVARELKH